MSAFLNEFLQRNRHNSWVDPEEIRRDLATWDFGNPDAAPGYTFVDKLVNKMGWDRTYAERVVEEFRRFAVLWAYYPGATHVPSTAVDEAWHLAILFTRRYARMGELFFGKFKHHNPSSSDVDRGALGKSYEQTLAQYSEVFGEEPPVDIWPHQKVAIAGNCNNGCGIGQCGRDCETKGCAQGCNGSCHFGCDDCG